MSLRPAVPALGWLGWLAERLAERLRWQEHGGPACCEPTRSGFGTRLVNAAFTSGFDARTALEFPPTGVCFALDADAGQILAGER